jgi:hypothetical protein
LGGIYLYTTFYFLNDTTDTHHKQVRRQLFKIAGSTDILGSPVQLLGDVSNGVFSFFYEPALALSLQEGIGSGLQRGSLAVLNQTGGSVLESLSKICKSIATAMASLVRGEEEEGFFALWMTRELNLQGFNDPCNVLEGVTKGTVLLSKCVLESIMVSGFIMTMMQRDIFLYTNIDWNTFNNDAIYEDAISDADNSDQALDDQ